MAQASAPSGGGPKLGKGMSGDSLCHGGGAGQERMQYNNKCELMLTLVGYAVGLGNVWRFPYLAYSFGGGAFLIPYACALLLLGLPLFILELGLGQMLRQGTLAVWAKLRLPRLQGVGVAATLTTFFVLLYYNVILGWTVYYIGRTLMSIGGPLPWTDQVDGFKCDDVVLIVKSDVANNAELFDPDTGLYNKAYQDSFLCPDTGAWSQSSLVPFGYEMLVKAVRDCPASAAKQFWEREAVWQSSGIDDIQGFHPGMVVSFTVAWLLIYGCICKGIASSGKVVYVTATMPYIALIAFAIRAWTLPNFMAGLKFFLLPDFSILATSTVWLRAVTQIFYSLGVGFGSLIAFASYGSKHSDFAMDATRVSLINCSTSIFAGLVVFPILGFLALELSEVDPCVQADSVSDLERVGLSGTGLAFIAFPIAISQMPGGMVWALLFFLMLLCLGVDSQFAMCESVITVVHDAGVEAWLTKRTGINVTKERFIMAFCLFAYALGLIFCTRAGLYWFDLFDNYTCVVAMFFVTLMECMGLMWMNPETYPAFVRRVKDWTGRQLGPLIWFQWKFFCPALLAFLTLYSGTTWDLMGAGESIPYPEGKGYLPPWSIYAGWALGMIPILGFVVAALACKSSEKVAPKEAQIGNGTPATRELKTQNSLFDEVEHQNTDPAEVQDRPFYTGPKATRAVELDAVPEDEVDPESRRRGITVTTLDGLTSWKGPDASATATATATAIGQTTHGIDISLDDTADASASRAPAPRMWTFVKCGPWFCG